MRSGRAAAVRRWIARLVSVTVAGLALPAVAVIFGAESWPWELANHFVRQFAAIALLAGVVLAAVGHRRAAAVAAIVGVAWAGMAWHAAIILNDAQADRRAPPGLVATGDPRTLKVLTFNVNRHNPQSDAVWAMIEAASADVVTLQEVPVALAETIDRIGASRYPHHVLVDVPNDYDYIAILSRHRIRAWSVIHPFDRAWSAIRAEIEPWPDHAVTVVTLHAWPPVSRQRLLGRDAYLRHVAGEVAAVAGPVVVTGDFNATPTTPVFRRFLADGGLAGGGFAPATWPSRLGAFGIPIDHVLARGLDVGEVTPMRGPGSDHRALMAELWITRTRH